MIQSQSKKLLRQKLGVIDMTASVMCMENKMPLMVFGLEEENSIVNALSGKFNRNSSNC